MSTFPAERVLLSTVTTAAVFGVWAAAAYGAIAGAADHSRRNPRPPGRRTADRRRRGG